MKINKLINDQAKRTQAHQASVQAIVKRNILKYGHRSAKCKKGIHSDLLKLVNLIVRDGIRSGIAWVENGNL